MLRGNNRRRLFSYSSDYRCFLRMVESATERFPVELHNLVLMTNHMHIIATPANEPVLSLWVKDFAHGWACQRNRQRNGTGKVFEQRFLSFVIDTDAYLAACTKYVELNPVRAGLKRSLEEYPWSTYRLHAGLEKSEVSAKAWTPGLWFIGLGKDDVDRRGAFREALGEYDGSGLPEKHERHILSIETLSDPYGQRLERPNRQRAF
ncbi:MAG TPA: transposase [Kofleriaceae bacterium]|nr:transposase [Kofleriaceae bacterium]